MTATLKLLALPFRRMPLAMGLLVLLYAGGLVLMVVLRQSGLVGVVAAAGWLGSMLYGMALRPFRQGEARWLPGFHRHLAWAGAVLAGALIAVPTAVAMMVGGAAHATLIASGLLLAAGVGVATGLGSRLMLLVWLVAIGIGWLPQDLLDGLGRILVHSPWVPLLMLLVAGMVLVQALRPFHAVTDDGDAASPLDVSFDGRRSIADADGMARPQGKLGKRISGVFDAIAQRTQARALTHWQRHPGERARMTLLRAVLLPRDSLSALAVRWLMVLAFAALYFAAMRQSAGWNAGYLGAYAVILGVARFAAVGQGMVRMRPNLADLYLTLAPARGADFQRIMADTLLWLVGTAIASALVYAAAVAVLLHAPDAPRLLLAALVAGTAAAFSALAVHLVGPESTLARGITNLVVMAGAALAYGLVYWLVGRFGHGFGTLAGCVLTLPFGFGAWQAARREYLKRPPRFDAPS